MASINNLTAVYADKFYLASSTGVSEISDTYATKTEVENLNFATDITANTDAIAVLNTKQLQNFNNINAINDDLTNNYQTNTVLATNFYNKTEIDTTLSNYYTSTQIDTNLSTNYQNNTLLATNFYNKGEVDTLIAGAGGSSGYTDTEIDNLLALRVPLSDFTDRFKANPVIDCSAPTIIHSGLTLNNETINISPTTGLLFSNQFGGGDKVVSVFKNATNYVTLQGNKIMTNATSDDSVVDLDLNPSGNVNITNDLSLSNLSADGISLTNSINLGGSIELTDGNTSIERYSNATKSNISLDLKTDQEALRLMLGASTDTDTNTFIECNNATGGTTVFKPTYFKDTINYEAENFNISNNSGLTIYKPTTDASNVVAIANNSGKLRFRGFSIDAYNTNDTSQQLFLNMNNSNAVRCNKLGIGANAVVDVLNVNGGNSNFSSTVRFNGATTFNNEILIWNNGKIYRRADANNSLNLITNDEINFSFQPNRATDPTTGTIALQLTDTNGITINRAVTNNQTFNSIGKKTAEADLDVWGGVYFQHSSAIKETLNGSDYDLDIRNGDTDRAINFIIGTIGSTPELQLTDGKVSLLGNLEITHDDITGQQRVLINNPDDNGWIRLSNNNLSTLDATTTRVDVYGDLSYTGSLIPSSDKRLKKDIKEVDSKKAVELIKYIKPKTYHFIDDRQQGKSCVGFIANDFMETKKMPDEWQNVVKEGKDGYLKFDYTTRVPILWSALQTTISEIDKLKKELNKLKKNKSDSDDALASSGRSRD